MALQQVLVGLSHPAEDVVAQVPVMGGVFHSGCDGGRKRLDTPEGVCV